MAAEEEEDEQRAIDGAAWAPIARSVADELESVARDGAKRTLAVLGVAADEKITSQTYTKAVEFARARAAELVGREWDGDELVDNDDASMSIVESLRDDLRDTIADAVENGDSAAELAARIEGMSNFSSERAHMIAQTELVRANNAAHMAAFRASGVVHMKSWSTSGEAEVCDECQANADQDAIDIDDVFDSGDDSPPAHPGCLCVVIPEVESSDDDESEDDDGDEDDE